MKDRIPPPEPISRAATDTQEIVRLRKRIEELDQAATKFKEPNRYARQVIALLRERQKTDVIGALAEWSVALSIETNTPRFTFTCKQCGDIASTMHDPSETDPELSAIALSDWFRNHRCLQHLIKCPRCFVNFKLLTPHYVDDEMAERQMVLWTEECASRSASLDNKPPAFKGMTHWTDDKSWVDIIAEPEMSYLKLFAHGPVAKNESMLHANVNLDDVKRIRAVLDAWIYAREHMTVEAIECDRCGGNGSSKERARTITCPQCNGMGRCTPNKTPLPGTHKP